MCRLASTRSRTLRLCHRGSIRRLMSPTSSPFFDDTSMVPYKLEDVRLFVSLGNGLSGSNRSSLISVDPFTGQLDSTIGQWAQPTGDLAIRQDGELFAYSLGPNSGAQNNGNTGNFLNINSTDATAASAGDDGLGFRRNNEAGTATEANPDGQLIINALAFIPRSSTSTFPGNQPNIQSNTGERALAVGNVDSLGRAGEVPAALARNVIYNVSAGNGCCGEPRRWRQP